jgi:hypothetical protein
VCLPEEIRAELKDTAYQKWDDNSRQELIVERLRRPPLTVEEKRKFLRARAPLLEKLRQRKAAAQGSNTDLYATVEG